MIDENILKQLEEYTILDKSEFGETCQLLINIARYDYALSDQLIATLKTEIENNLEYYKQQAIIVKETQTYTHVHRYIEWKS